MLATSLIWSRERCEEIDVAEIGGSGGDGRLGVSLRPYQARDCFPRERRPRCSRSPAFGRAPRPFRKRRGLYPVRRVLMCALAEADFEFGIVRRENHGLIEFWHGVGIKMLFEKDAAQSGVRHEIERIALRSVCGKRRWPRDISAGARASSRGNRKRARRTGQHAICFRKAAAASS